MSGEQTEGFTEDAYRRALVLAKRSYTFEPFGSDSVEPHVLWRHDVDVSVHRAARLGALEADEDVSATYFFSFHSSFYNLLERSVLDQARATLRRGHALGLHFDSSFYGRIDSADQLTEHVAREAHQLGELMEAAVSAVSFHNPGSANDDLAFDDDRIAGLVNAYGRTIRDRYEYVSDSNGYWRFRRLLDILEHPGTDRLHVLTHPVWWQEAKMAPRERIVRSVDGRARAVLREYDELLRSAERENVR
jgi:hypothetical protein